MICALYLEKNTVKSFIIVFVALSEISKHETLGFMFTVNRKMAKYCEVPHSCPTLCDPMGRSLPGSSTHGIFQASILEWVSFPSPGYLPNPGIELRSPIL